ncbi:MAG: hypothetical protein HY890_06590 [Deltaproteobacteria bacterium]|nr:hypothetical protein [Deltaproteobacteria bacterium]
MPQTSKNITPEKNIFLSRAYSSGAYILFALLLVSAVKPVIQPALPANQPSSTASASENGTGLTLVTDKPVYSAGEPVKITLRVFNRAGKDVTLYFTSAQRYDFVIKDREGRDLWRWGEGRMFAAAAGTETIGPKRPAIIYSEKFGDALKPGFYGVAGLTTDRDKTFSAETKIEIKGK